MAMQRRCRKCLPEHSPDAFAMGTMPGRSGCCRSGNGRHGVVPMCRVWRVVPRLPRCPTPTVCRDGRSFQRTPSPDCVGNTLSYRGLVRRDFGHTPRLMPCRAPCRVSGPTQGFRFGGHQGIFRRCGTATRRRAAIPPARLTSGMHEATMLHPIAVHHGMPCEAGALWRGLLSSLPRGHAQGAKKGPVKQGLKTLEMGRMMGLEPTATWATTRCSTC